MTDPTTLSAREIREAIGSGALSCEEVTSAHLERIAAHDPSLRALLTLDAGGALETARDMDGRLSRGEAPPPLAGVPVLVKDNLCTRGLRTTCGSRILGEYAPPYDATAVGRLRCAGAVILGKTNMDEFAMGSSTEHSAFGPTRNPWDPSRVPGGSSGGSAAAVAAGFAPLALGSDTGGSVRQPAAFCGAVGLRPTYGRVSRRGLVAFASSLDQVGTLSRTVEDAFLLLSVISGSDAGDATCAPIPPFAPRAGGAAGQGLRVGLVREHLEGGLDPEIRGAVLSATEALRGSGAEIREVSLPHSAFALAAYTILNTAEASSNLARYDGVRFGVREPGPSAAVSRERTRSAGFGAEVKRRILLGTFVLSEGYREAYYGKALRARALVARDFEEAFAQVEVLLGPTAPTTAFKLGEKDRSPLDMYLSDVFTVPSNLAGLPGLSVPYGFSRDGLPLAVQLVGRRFEEDALQRVGTLLERTAPDFGCRPPRVGGWGP